jgi:hypothetical protein
LNMELSQTTERPSLTRRGVSTIPDGDTKDLATGSLKIKMLLIFVLDFLDAKLQDLP